MIAADALMIVLRLFHIVGGVLWVGSAFLFVAVIGPSAAEVGPSAGPLLTVAVKKRKVHKLIVWFGMSTVTAGWLMWLKDLHDYSDWHLGTWVFHTSGFGLALTLGGILATIALFEGYYGVGKNVVRLVDVGGEMAMSAGPPAPELVAQMGKLQDELKKHGQTDIALLLVAVALMATARYW
jgi:hypothetical protein